MARPTSRQSRSGRRPQTTANPSRSAADTHEIDTPYFGDTPGDEVNTRFRVGCLNINRVSPTEGGKSRNSLETESKHDMLCKLVNKMHLDVTMIQEVGVNWSKVSRNNQWKARAGKHLDPNHTQSFMSYNHHDPTSHAHQWGGTGIMSYGRLAHHSAGAGGDNEKLGRWAWARYMGKDGIRLRCVSVYRPCEGGTGTETVSAQQRQYFLSKNEDKEPRQAWLIDFEAALQSWLAAGDQIIVGGTSTTMFGQNWSPISSHDVVCTTLWQTNMTYKTARRHTAEAPISSMVCGPHRALMLQHADILNQMQQLAIIPYCGWTSHIRQPWVTHQSSLILSKRVAYGSTITKLFNDISIDTNSMWRNNGWSNVRSV